MAGKQNTRKRTTTTIPAGAKVPGDRMSKRPRTETVTVPMDDAVVHALRKAEQALEAERMRLDRNRDAEAARILADRRARGGTANGQEMDLTIVRLEVEAQHADQLVPLEKSVQAARDEVDATTRDFVFHALGNARWKRLLGEHKPDDDDHAQAQAEGVGQRAAFKAETFAPALVEACCDDLDEAEVDAMFDGPVHAECDGEGCDGCDDGWEPSVWNLAELTQLFQAAYAANTQRAHIG